MDDVDDDVGKAKVAALKPKRQLEMVQAEQMQNRGLQIVDVDAILAVGLADGR